MSNRGGWTAVAPIGFVLKLYKLSPIDCCLLTLTLYNDYINNGSTIMANETVSPELADVFEAALQIICHKAMW
jgi:hypothetical protein